MPRPRKRDKTLPTRVYRKGKVYYFVTTANKWIRLGDSESEMYRALADVKAGADQPTVRGLWERYEREVLPDKAAKTQYEQRHQWTTLEPVFGDSQPNEVRSVHVAAYLDQRSARVAANREIALLSHIFRKAIRWGLAESNPCDGVERNRERPDERYITDEEFAAVYSQAPDHVQLAMDLALLTGQRQADILALRRDQLQDEGIAFKQAKTGKRLIVRWSDDLRAVVSRALGVESAIASVWVLHNRHGQRYSASGFQTTWQKLIRRCLEQGVIAERFTFRAIRAKARSDGTDKRLLGHADPSKMARYYQRKPELVEPVQRASIRNDLEKKGAS